MKNVFYRLAFRASELMGTWQAFRITSAEDRAAAVEVLDRVRRQELRRQSQAATVLDSNAFEGAALQDDLLGVREARTGKLVGCVRSVRAHQLAGVPASRLEYGLDLIPDEIMGRSGIATRLVILPEYRTSPAAMVLLQFMYETGLDEGYDLCLLACEPGLYRMYLKLGFRPLGASHPSPSGGFRIPMVLVNEDLEHLEAVGSPLARALARRPRRPHAPGRSWYAGLVAERGAIDPGVGFYRYEEDEDEAIHAALTEGMTPAGKAGLLDGAVTLTCQPGQVVLELGDGGRQMGFVEDGLLQVERDGQALALLGPGELFGELAWVRGVPRTARVVASTPDTRILLLSQRAPERLASPEDREALWCNLARVLATRVVAVRPR